MATTTQQLIEVIGKLRVDRRSVLALLKKTGIANYKVGNEGEYQVQGLIGGIESLLIDISALVKVEKSFLVLSNFGERQNLLSTLTTLNGHLSSVSAHLALAAEKGFVISAAFQYMNQAGAATQIPINEIVALVESLKPLLRSFRTKEAPERFQELAEQASSFVRAKQDCEVITNDITTLRDHATKIQGEITQLLSQGNDANKEIASIKASASTELANVDAIKKEATEQLQHTQQLLTEIVGKSEQLSSVFAEASAQSAVIDQLSKRSESRNIELDRQSSLTSNYEGRLKEFEATHNTILQTIKQTAEQARRVLGMSGEVALGSHFKKQFEAATRGQYLWICFSVVLFAAAIYLGHETVTQSGDDSIAYLKRFTLVPLALLGAYFCGRQYEKQRNITEDYAHKKVLALSLPSFKEQLAQDPGRLDEYLQKVLSELHQYPLALQEIKRDSSIDAKPADLFKELLEEVKSLRGAVTTLVKGDAN